MALQDIPVRNFCKCEAAKLSKKTFERSDLGDVADVGQRKERPEAAEE
jgi:hypothetical protein